MQSRVCQRWAHTLQAERHAHLGPCHSSTRARHLQRGRHVVLLLHEAAETEPLLLELWLAQAVHVAARQQETFKVTDRHSSTRVTEHAEGVSPHTHRVICAATPR
jgi:hypothetical protein